MSSFAETVGQRSSLGPARVTPIREPAGGSSASQTSPLRDEQIQALVQQLFFHHNLPPVRRVGFTASEYTDSRAQLCFDVALSLAQHGQYDVGLIDADPLSSPLQTKLKIPTDSAEDAWLIAPKLWLVPRQSWLPDVRSSRIGEQSLSRLRALTAEFDFSILRCPAASWLTTTVSRACDGLVLVLTAHKTRRLVAIQMSDQLRRAHIPLLGTVLAERRCPLPQGLYRRL